MRFPLNRRFALPLAGAVAAALCMVGASAASADTDPVTSGTATMDLSWSAASTFANSHLYIVPTKPATLTYDTTNSVVEYDLPVIGGDASTNTLFGTLTLDGGLMVSDTKTKRSVTLTDLTFDISADTISGTPSTTGVPVVLFDALGNHDYTTTNPETFSASSLVVDGAGAKLLDTTLHVHGFHKGTVIGSFNTTFTNTNDG